ncbi:hypothetical protein GQX73_g380 [Xylaria multiplex]|uniref:AAA+ ATPase domain-containing protein n=1 Tax=Xylaria multiplex TaxID=323545 RepID=A0A7C8N176_9PEZI|nr:hypothetical protein GQX73_g380 [Xylaria multiplex]
MENTEEGPLVLTLVRQIASLEKRCIELEARCSNLETSSSAATAIIAAPVAADTQTEDSEKESKSLSSRVKVIIIKRDSYGGPFESKEELPRVKEEDTSQYAFVLKKIIFDSIPPRRHDSSEIDITSLDLWNLLKKHLRWYPYHIFSDSPKVLYSPFEPIVFSWDKLLEEASKGEQDNNEDARDDLKLLLDTISGGSSGDKRLDKFFTMRDSYRSQQPEKVQFTDLWTIFAPGTLIYGKPFQNEDQVFVVKDSTMAWPRQEEGSEDYSPWSLEAWSYDRKDDSFGRSTYVLRFEHFVGHLPLTALPYYPFNLHEDYDLVRTKLIERGKLFQKYCNANDGSRMFDYKGDAISEKKGFSGMRSEEDQHEPRSSDLDFAMFRRLMSRDLRIRAFPSPNSSYVEGRVMVDYGSFYQYGSTNGRNGSLSQEKTSLECGCSDCQDNEGLAKRYRTHFDKKPGNQNWEDEQYLLCPPRVLGYILGKKEWAQLQVTHLKEIPEVDSQNAWLSRLKLADEGTKKLLFDLVTYHVSSEKQDANDENLLSVDDIVPGKGKGLVILLYGPPGVGKSSTAETIAVAARKPLFSISVADVGTKATLVESNLSKIFSLATYWKAILLIDEADVFLESRGRGNIVQSTDKNALVSVFLRVLEYYKGIMFLTTNQIADFDIAIPSRIHVAIKYESLKVDQMEAIFKGFLDNLNRKNQVDNYTDIINWLREDVYPEGLDGRQIRNTITTALDLANAEKGNDKLRKYHIKRAFNNVKHFKRDFNVQMQRYKDSQQNMIQ